MQFARTTDSAVAGETEAALKFFIKRAAFDRVAGMVLAMEHCFFVQYMSSSIYHWDLLSHTSPLHAAFAFIASSESFRVHTKM